MQAKGAIALVFVVLASLASGYWMGHPSGSFASAAIARPFQRELTNTTSAASNPIAVRTKAPLGSAGLEEAKPSLAAIDEKFATSKERIRPKEWEKLMDS